MIRRRFRESVYSKYSRKELVSPNMFQISDFKCRSIKLQDDDEVGYKRLSKWKEERVPQSQVLAGTLPDLVEKFMSYVADQSGEPFESIPTPFVDVDKHTFTISITQEYKKYPNPHENGTQYRLFEYSCKVSMDNSLTDILDSFCAIAGQLECNR